MNSATTYLPCCTLRIMDPQIKEYKIMTTVFVMHENIEKDIRKA